MAGDTSEFLLHMQYDRASTDEIELLGPGGYFAVASHFARLGAEDRARDLYAEAVQREEEPWRSWALLRLTESLVGEEEYREVVRLLAGEPTYYPAIAYQYGTALYELNRYGPLLRFIEEYRGAAASQGAAADGKREIALPFQSSDLPEEMLIWESVSHHQEGRVDATLDVAEELFRFGSASQRQGRLFLYLQYYGLIDRLPEGVWELLLARIALDEGRWEDSAQRFLSVDPALLGEESLYDLYLAFRNARYFATGSDYLLAALPAEGGALPSELTDRAGYYAGTLLLSSGEHDLAVQQLRAALSGPGTLSKTIVRSQLLRAAARSGEAAVGELLPDLLSTEEGALATSSTLEEVIYLLSRGPGGLPAEQGEQLLQRGPAGRGAQVALLARHGLAALREPESALRAAQAQREELFYRFLAYASLPEENRLPVAELLLLTPASAGEAAPGPLPEPFSEEIVSRLLDFGLHQELYSLGLEYGDRLSPPLLDKVAEQLQRTGRFYESLRVLHWADYPRTLGSLERARLLYPRAYRPLMATTAEREGLDPAVWYGLVREESFFSSSVASHAGAVGLSQLMPATAMDIGGRMGLSQPELTDPEVNLSIGGRYFGMLSERFGGPVPALAAYNAGQGRVRRWLAANPANTVAFHQSIPFRETRHHVRKVLVSAVYYNYLYFDVPPEETVRRFFPDLMEQD